MTRGFGRRSAASAPASGFSLVELLTALAVFLIICGVAFALLTSSSKRYQSDGQVLAAFQEARFGLDQIIRDINDSGYPPVSNYATIPTDAGNYAITAIAWPLAEGYPNSPCQIPSCSTPSQFDLILETKVDPLSTTAKVKWIRYKLQSNTLYRAIVDKPASGGDPDAATASQLVPYVQNVMNNTSSGQIAQFQAIYPDMFSGGAPVDLFKYTCDTATRPMDCSTAGSDNSPQNIRGVSVTLIVMAPFPDAQTGQPRLVELRGQGRRINPVN